MTSAEIAANAIVDEARKSVSDRRFVLRTYLGLDLDRVHAALLSASRSTIDVTAGFEQVVGRQRTELGDLTAFSLKCILTGPGPQDPVIVPFRVSTAVDGLPNRGSQGFAATLRSAISAATPRDDERPRVLVFFDARPVETILTSAEDMATTPELSWGALCRRAIAQPTTDDLGSLILAIAEDLAQHAKPEAQMLDRLIEFSAARWNSVAEAGASLYQLGRYLADPTVTKTHHLAERLRKGAAWRQDLEAWAAPGNDLDRRLAEKRISEDVASRISLTLNSSGLDYSRFTLDELLGAGIERGLRLTRPLRVDGGAAITTAYQGRDVIIAWLPGGGSVSVLLSGDPDGSEKAFAHVNRVKSATATVLPAARRLQIDLANQDESDWASGTVELRTDGGSRSIGIMAFFGEGSWFPIERRLAVDVDICAFLVDGEPDVIAAGSAGQFLRSAAVADWIGGSEPEAVSVTALEETCQIPLLSVGVGGGDDVDDGGNGEDSVPGADGDGDGEEAGDRDDDDRPAPPQGNRRLKQRSPMHAALEVARSLGSSDIGEVLYDASGFLTVGSAQYEIEEHALGGLSLTQIEAEILASPRTTSFLLTPDGVVVPGAVGLNSADLGPEAERFLSARERLFAKLAKRGSVHALAAGVDLSETGEYLDAYACLLEAPERGHRYTPQYDALIMCDSVLIGSTGEVVIAPTNPLSIAFYATFAEAVGRWIQDQQLPSSADVAAIGARHLLPMFNHDDRWFESLPDQPFAWRRYQPMFNAAAPADHDPRLIAERMKFFLTVYPVYDDPRQRLCVLFRDPSMSTVGDALRRFYSREISRARNLANGQVFERPALDVIFVSDSPDIEKDVRQLLERAGDDVVDRILRERVAFRVVEPSDADEIFCHVAFLFGADVTPDPWRVALDERAPTSFVGGLATGPGRVRLSSAGDIAFAWGTFAPKLCGELSVSTSASFERIVRGSLELVGAQPRELIVAGHTRMPTATVRDIGLPELYENSVWVVHLNHLLGLDAFQSEAAKHLYIIDYKEGDDPESPGLDAITVTSKVDPYHHALSVALSDLADLSTAGRDSILSVLNGVSGKWALQLLRQAPHQIRERIGTAAAVVALRDLDDCFVGDDDTFAVLVPLEEVWSSLERRAATQPIHPACDDLVYLRVAAPDGEGVATVYTRLIEVKYRTGSIPDAAESRAELESARMRLRNLFDPIGVSRLFRGRDLSELIRSARIRNQAFGLSAATRCDSAEESLAAIGAGAFKFVMDYTVGADRLGGDVISVEAHNLAPATRLMLPGEGCSFGLVRLGRDALSAMAQGESVPRPDVWAAPAFVDGDGPCGERPETATSDVTVTSDLHLHDRSLDQRPVEVADETTAVSKVVGHGTDEEVRRVSTALDQAALKYGLGLEPFQPHLAQIGPSVIRFRTRPLGRQTIGAVQRLALDLGREVGVGEGVLVEQEAYFITVDVPRAQREVIRYTDYAHVLERDTTAGALDFLVGMAPSGQVEIADLARLPHLLVAGATGSGKSVFLRGLLAALVRRRAPGQLKVLLVDPKQVDFLQFEDLPHLLFGRPITDPGEALAALADTIETERDRRLPVLKQAGVTNVLEFYESGGAVEEMPQIVVLVDEFADLATSMDRDDRTRFMGLIQRYGQVTRAFGIYLVLATQRPSVQVITGDIKANLTARIALKMQSPQDSVTILGRGGAERLRDQGDLIFDHGGAVRRLQGFFTSGRDAKDAVDRWLV